MSALRNAFKGFDPNDMDFNAAGNWPIGVKIVCYLIVLVAICAAGWHFYITDKQSALKKEISKEQGLKAVYKEKAFQVANLDALRKQMEDVEEKFSELKKQLPTEKEVPGLLDDITNLGTDSGLDIGSIKLAAESKKEFYIELPININVSGSYHQLGQFVSGIAGLPRIVTLHDYTIKPSSGKVSMQISAKTYRYDETK
ncbi:type 4a pilus biogenesis protein PilO [Neptuniibacter sp. 1_MG-2023]|uniref:type 4a pilus biogenesis protein PilO n=1 Tax=Neptuniibacter sp. 1_MG-2023 TaxID=3062662 RepID=UPI0026E37284|nr:type 4a pilus biogenesis protein PilO [Neptuniibacter sp. 1_MG-2023]MDO6593203.1 type 4a pilus biogenesis protein PilO [Neptuniibacter sp. 1_MG-2023]